MIEIMEIVQTCRQNQVEKFFVSSNLNKDGICILANNFLRFLNRLVTPPFDTTWGGGLTNYGPEHNSLCWDKISR